MEFQSIPISARSQIQKAHLVVYINYTSTLNPQIVLANLDNSRSRKVPVTYQYRKNLQGKGCKDSNCVDRAVTSFNLSFPVSSLEEQPKQDIGKHAALKLQ